LLRTRAGDSGLRRGGSLGVGLDLRGMRREFSSVRGWRERKGEGEDEAHARRDGPHAMMQKTMLPQVALSALRRV
jgi:hypothetical protein